MATGDERTNLGYFAAFTCGISDALFGLVRVFRLCKRSAEMRSKMVQSLLLNGLFLCAAMFFFENVVLPFLGYLGRLIRFSFTTEAPASGAEDGSEVVEMALFAVWMVFRGLWVLPLHSISRPINSLFFLEIFEEAIALLKEEKNANLQSSMSRTSPAAAARRKESRAKRPRFTFAVWIADVCFSIAVEASFIGQAMLSAYIPFIGFILSIGHFGLLYALYSFEYVWMDNCIPVRQRLTRIEENWPYYLGFGLPLAMVMTLSGSMYTSTALFGVLFPSFLVISCDVPPVTANVRPLRVFYFVTPLINRVARFVAFGLAYID
eukprot:m.311323 g.311323  ORF g.311323 m.311323 type:complete len:321 (+) comp65209_c0_seq1:311-1273(+)